MAETTLTDQTTQKQPATTRVVLSIVGVSLLLGLVFVFAWGLQTRESTQLSGRSAPDFELSTFEGEKIALSDLRGQVVVVNFWASWCVECYKEAELLEQAHRDFRNQGVVFLGVDYLDTDKEALAYMERYGITYPSGPDIASKISKSYQITGVPETIFVDQTGDIYHVQIGPIQEHDLYQLLETMITEGAS